jgi:hypothetical protein
VHKRPRSSLLNPVTSNVLMMCDVDDPCALKYSTQNVNGRSYSSRRPEIDNSGQNRSRDIEGRRVTNQTNQIATKQIFCLRCGQPRRCIQIKRAE